MTYVLAMLKPELLLSALDGEPAQPPLIHELPLELVERMTTAPPKPRVPDRE